MVKISGPWRAAILYALEKQQNEHYDAIFEGQFFDLNQHQALPLPAFVDALCDNFTRYQRFADGQYAIVPTPKQKAFLQARLAALPPSALRRPPAPASSRAVATRRHRLPVRTGLSPSSSAPAAACSASSPPRRSSTSRRWGRARPRSSCRCSARPSSRTTRRRTTTSRAAGSRSTCWWSWCPSTWSPTRARRSSATASTSTSATSTKSTTTSSPSSTTRCGCTPARRGRATAARSAASRRRRRVRRRRRSS